jgi:hypothetical protein
MAELVGGKWFSTPAEGECKGPQSPGDGSGCTWKVKQVVAVKNQTCVKDNVYGTVEKHCAAAFNECAVPYNRSDACYSQVFFDAVLGNSTLGCKPMTIDELLKPWTASFDSNDTSIGGCPSLPTEFSKNGRQADRQQLH